MVIFAHPDFQNSIINKTIISSIKNLEGITIHNLYKEYPGFEVDVKREQQLLLEHDVIVWQHPFYWYSAPALLKEWMDKVLQRNFAYGSNGKALKGKYIFNALTSGGEKEAYQNGGANSYTIKQFLFPFEQTARLCSMHYLPPFVIHGARVISTEKLKSEVEIYVKVLTYLRGDINLENISGYNYFNDFIKTYIK